MSAFLKSRWAKIFLFLLSLLPALLLAWGAYNGDLGANPVERITHRTGTWALRFLLFTLTITPARRLLHLLDLIRFRRMLGLFAFFYGFLHLMTWMWLDKFFDPTEMWNDVVKRRFITAGMLAFSLMVPLAITSTKGWIRRLGRRWQQLHRLIYFSAAIAVIHYYWLVKSDIREPLFYGAVLTALLLLRLYKSRQAPAVRPAVQQHSPVSIPPGS